jgi:PAS domain S-box-containing protein
MNKDFEARKERLRKQAEARLAEASRPVDELSPEEIKTLLHEYQVHQIELELQNEELRNAQKQLESARDQFARLYNDAPVGYLTIDEAGIISQTNQTFAVMVGLEPHHLTGKPLTDFITSADQSVFHGRFKAFFKNPTDKQLDFTLQGKRRNIPVRCVGSAKDALPAWPGKGASQHLLLAVMDISEQVRAEGELRMSNLRLQAILNHSPLLISEFDLNGRYLLINPAVASVLHLEPSQVEGRTFEELLPSETVKKFKDRIAQVQSAALPIHVEDSLHVNNDVRHFLTTLFPLPDGAGEMPSIGAIAHDITDRKRAEEEIKSINQQLQKANAEKDKLFAIIAHDLKSPMSGLLASSEMMAEQPELLSERDIRTLSKELHKSARNTFALLEDLLQWARMSQGGIDYAPKPCSLKELINMSLYTAKDIAKKKDVAIRRNIPSDLTVLVDQPMINTVIRNVLFNAIKFTRRGGEIVVTAHQKGQVVTMAIQDNGIGMNQNMLSSIFSLEKEKRQLGTEGETGTGLGLVLCKQFIEQHDEQIWVESEPGRGTTVFFTLPVSD